MKFSILLAGLCLFSVSSLEAQRVKRKGVEPVNVGVKTNDMPAPKFDVKLLKGRWKESKRFDAQARGRREVAFEDTMYLHFMDEKNVLIREGKFMNVRGEFDTYGDILNLSGNEFKVLQLNTKEILLSDGEVDRLFIPVEIFDVETFGKDKLKTDTLAANVPLNEKAFLGKWSVYRTQSSPSDVSTLLRIRRIEVISENGSSQWQGNWVVNKEGVAVTNPISVQHRNGRLLVDDGEKKLEFNIQRSSEKELVIAINDVIYYFKKDS